MNRTRDVKETGALTEQTSSPTGSVTRTTGRRALPRGLWLRAGGALSVVAFLLAWQFVSASGLISSVLLPSPVAVIKALVRVVENGYRGTTLLGDALVTLGRCLGGFVLATIVGVPLGLGMGSSKRLAASCDYLIQFLRPLPPLSYMILLILWFGAGEESKVVLLFLTAFPIVVSAAMAGVRNVPRQRLQAASMLGASRRQIFWHVTLPSSLPLIFTGLKIAFAAAFQTVVAAELLTAQSGLGWMVLSASKYLDNALVILGVILLGLIGMTFSRLLHALDLRFIHWRRVG